MERAWRWSRATSRCAPRRQPHCCLPLYPPYSNRSKHKLEANHESYNIRNNPPSNLAASPPLWQVHKFSKFIHGTATLLPDMVRAVPYWMDDESLVHSINASAPALHSSTPAGTQLHT